MKHFILGGARSGKSHYAQQIAQQTAAEHKQQLIYIATASAGDEEMRQRIQLHQQQRTADWQLVEEPLRLAQTLQQLNNRKNCLLVDCLTLWLSNCLAWGDGAFVENQQRELLHTLSELEAEIILVSNEVGQGIVPMGELSRRFVDESGRLHQQLSTLCDRVVFMTAGLPQILKS